MASFAPAEGAFTVTLAFADFVGSATLVAVTTTDVDAATLGAVNIPSELTVPALALQITAVFAVLARLTLNCWTAPEASTTVSGEIVGARELVPPFVAVLGAEFAEQPPAAAIRASARKNANSRTGDEQVATVLLALGRGNANISPSENWSYCELLLRVLNEL
jgi:hypothetical protein